MAREWTIRMQRCVAEFKDGYQCRTQQWRSHELTAIITGRFTVGQDLPERVHKPARSRDDSISSFALQEAGSTNVDPVTGTSGSDKGPTRVEPGTMENVMSAAGIADNVSGSAERAERAALLGSLFPACKRATGRKHQARAYWCGQLRNGG